MIVLDHDGLVGLGDGLSVDCDFDHFSSFFRSSTDAGRVWMCLKDKGEIRNLRVCPTRFYMLSTKTQPERSIRQVNSPPITLGFARQSCRRNTRIRFHTTQRDG